MGCPVRRREWIIGEWFDHVEMASVELGWRPTYAFVGDRNDPTMRIVADRCASQDRRVLFAHVDEDLERPDERNWNGDRFGRMVELRNLLLGLVRVENPDYFLSLDSDILLAPKALEEMVESCRSFAAVGGATYMTTGGDRHPSCGWIEGQRGFHRKPMEAVGVVRVGVIMAIKLMTPAAYAVDYEMHVQGEDIGWSRACALAGVRLGWDNRSISKHVMEPDHLSVVDTRIGW